MPTRAKKLTTRELLSNASDVIVGAIRDIRVSGDRQRTPEGVLVRRWQIELDVSCTIKGRATNKTTFFANNYEPGIVQNGDFEWLKAGDRRIFFLVQEGRYLRAVSDLYRCSLRFPHSGCPVISRADDEPTGDTIARLLLTRGPGEPARAFAEMIPLVAPDALRVAGYSLASSILRELSASDNPIIRNEACLTAYEQVFGDESCLDGLEHAQPSSGLSQRVLTARNRRAYIRQLAADSLRERRRSPLIFYAFGVEPEDAQSVRNFYEFLARRRDDVFRRSAARELERLHGLRVSRETGDGE